MTEEERRLLMDLARQLRAAAETIDKITKPRKQVQVDMNGEKKFVYQAKVPIPADIYLTKRMGTYAVQEGFTPEETRVMWEEFISYYSKTLRKWADWNRVWFDWVRREKKRRGERQPVKKTGKSLPVW